MYLDNVLVVDDDLLDLLRKVTGDGSQVARVAEDLQKKKIKTDGVLKSTPSVRNNRLFWERRGEKKVEKKRRKRVVWL